MSDMNKKNVIIAVVVLAVIVLMVVFTGGSRVNIADDGKLTGEYSIKDVLNLKQPYECTFMKDDGASTINGALRIAEGKVRGDFDIKLSDKDGGSFASHLIIKDDVSYSWTSIQPIGWKTEVAKSAEGGESQSDQAQLVGINDKAAYTCNPWNANLTVFDLPSGITFLELNQ